MQDTDRKVDFSIIKRSFQFIKPNMGFIAVATLLSLIVAAVGAIAPQITGDMMNAIIASLGGGSSANINKLAVTLAVMYTAEMVCSYGYGVLSARYNNANAQSMRDKLFSKLMRIKMEKLDAAKTGDILSRFTNDGETMAADVTSLLTTFAPAILELVVCLTLMIRASKKMTVVVIASVILSAIAMVVTALISQKYFVKNQEIAGKVSGKEKELLSSLQTIFAMNARQQAAEEFQAVNKEQKDITRIVSMLTGALLPIVRFFGDIGYVAVCVIGGWMAVQHEIDFGTVTMFIIYENTFNEPIQSLLGSTSTLQSISAAGKRFFEIYDWEEETQETQQSALEAEAGIHASNLSFSYPLAKDHVVLNKMSFDLHPGTAVAIAGKTGAGKTTLAQLLLKFYDVERGQLFIGDKDVADIDPHAARRHFASVLQSTWCFEGSIRDNLTMGAEFPDESVRDACELCGLSATVRTLPNGLETTLNESSTLSDGQKQLMAIARAVLADRPAILLDEATSSVDMGTERLIQAAIQKATKGRLSIIIAHRLNTIQNADQILVIQDGIVVESGSHSELIAKHGVYCDLINSQDDFI